MGSKAERSGLSPLQIELREAMAGWGCPLCRLSERAERGYIDSLNYERVLDLKTRDALKASRGLCEHHSQVWRDVQGSALPIAIVYRVAVLDLLRDTEVEASPSRGIFRRKVSAAGAADRLTASGECPACGVGEDAANRFGGLLLQEVTGDEFQAALTSSGGLCLSHLRQVLMMPGASRVADDLLKCQRQAWANLLAELEEYIRKNDYRFISERITTEEGTSWLRALGALTGLDASRLDPALSSTKENG